jgi:hypothetical protein
VAESVGVESNGVHALWVNAAYHVHEGAEVQYHFYTDFSEYTLAAVPSDWTERQDSSSDWTIVHNARYLHGSALKFTNPGSTAQYGISWDSVPSQADAEILLLVNVEPYVASGALGAGPWIRGAGAAGAEEGYAFGCFEDLLNSISLLKNDWPTLNWSVINIDSDTHYGHPPHQGEDLDDLNDYWIRGKAEGTSLKFKIWQRGTEEPSHWCAEGTDSAVSAAGWIGVYANRLTSYIHYFAVGIHGYSPPLPLSSDFGYRFPGRITQASLSVVRDGDPDARITQVSLSVVRSRNTLVVSECYHDLTSSLIRVAGTVGGTNQFSMSEAYSYLADDGPVKLTEIPLGPVNLVVNDGPHVTFSDVIDLAQHFLATAECAHVLTDDAPLTVVTAFDLVIAPDPYHTFHPTSDEIAAFGLTITTAETYHVLADDGPVWVIMNPIPVQECGHVLTNDAITLELTLAVGECAHTFHTNDVITAFGITLSTTAECAHTFHTNDVIAAFGITLSTTEETYHVLTNDAINPFSVRGASHALVDDGPIWIWMQTLQMQGAYHVLTNDAIIWNQHFLVTADSAHVLTDDAPLAIGVTLAVSECAHTFHTNDVITAWTLTLATTEECAHVLTNDAITAWDLTLSTTAECAHVLTNDAITGFDFLITTSECAHVLTDDAPLSLAEVFSLTVQEAAHVLTDDAPLTLVHDHYLIVLECDHIHVGDNVSFGVSLALQDCFHLHVLPPPAEMGFDITLTQTQEAYHVVYSPKVSIIPPTILQNLDCHHSVYSDQANLYTVWFLDYGKTSVIPDYESVAAFGVRAQCIEIPNLGGKVYVIGAAIYCGDTHSSQLRAGLYESSDHDGPEGEDLVVDMGTTVGNAVNQYIELSCAQTLLTPGDHYWLAFKGDDEGDFKWAYDFYYEFDYQNICLDMFGSNYSGYWIGGDEGVDFQDPDESVAYEDPWPADTDGFGLTTWVIGMYLRLKIEVNAYLTVKPAAHAIVSDNLTITYKEVLKNLPTYHVVASDTIDLAQHFLAVADCAHVHAADNVAFVIPLSVNECAHVVFSDNLIIALGVQETYHVLTDDSPLTLTEVWTLNPHEQISMVITDDECVLTQEHTLVVQEAAHTHASENVALSVHLTLAECFHDHVPDNVVIQEWELLTISDCAHVHAADLITLQLTVTVAEAAHVLYSDSIVLTQEHTLADLESFHVLADDLTRIFASQDIIVQESAHVTDSDTFLLQVFLYLTDSSHHILTSDPVALTQDHTLLNLDAWHVTSSSNVAIIVPLIVLESAHLVTSDTVLLAQSNSLAVSGIFHLLVTDPILLSQLHYLEVAGTGTNVDYNFFVLTSDNIEFTALEAGLAGKYLTIVEWVR